MKKGGGPLPLSYFDPNASQPSASAGDDMLAASGQVVRPKIGGKAHKRATHKRATHRRSAKGGFIPSVMEPFAIASSKYIMPLALYAGYRLMQRKQTKRKQTKRKTAKRT